MRGNPGRAKGEEERTPRFNGFVSGLIGLISEIKVINGADQRASIGNYYGEGG